jgi:hypothetical protein
MAKREFCRGFPSILYHLSAMFQAGRHCVAACYPSGSAARFRITSAASRAKVSE